MSDVLTLAYTVGPTTVYFTGSLEERINFIRSFKTQQSLPKVNAQEEETMNDNLNTPEFKPVPVVKKVPLSDAELEKLLAEKALYVTDADETADEPTPTTH